MSADVLTIQVQDTIAGQAVALFTIPILNPVDISTGVTLPSATQGVAYSTPLTFVGTAAFTPSVIGQGGTNVWTMSGSNLTGTPTSVETDTPTVLVFDALNRPAAKRFSLTVISGGGGGTLFLNFPAVVPGSVGVQMAFSMTGFGPGYTAPITAATASIGAIDSTGYWTFTPGGAGNQVVTINFTDSAGHTGSGSFTCVIT